MFHVEHFEQVRLIVAIVNKGLVHFMSGWTLLRTSERKSFDDCGTTIVKSGKP